MRFIILSSKIAVEFYQIENGIVIMIMEQQLQNAFSETLDEF